ncbi:hypothetical protein [Desulfonema magnum]|uniref:Uncharacterized protein n=1 Tax=Desulfonema magnum TaxID=45655 RepID=A0A975GPP7_9BACT|nr:hypothetical protein [Desulfonema magnum]QTA89231.1 Uncharacterized protein dnm_052810 [Desulfonema magnum]
MNPYNILKLDQTASKADIIRATAQAMRERTYSGREIAEAQKELMDPVSKAAHEFICFIDVKPFLEICRSQISTENSDSSVNSSDLKYLHISENGL